MRSPKPFAIAAAAVALAALAGSARADVCASSVALRVNGSGLTFIAEQAKAFIPTTIALPAIKKTVVDWPLTSEDAVVDIAALSATIELHTLTLSINQGALRLQGTVDVTTSGPVFVDNPYAGFGSANCSANVQLRNLSIDAGLKVATVGGKIQVSVTHAKVDLDNDQSVVALEGCTLGDILSAVVTFVRKHFLGTIQSKIEDLAMQKIPALVAARLEDTISITKELKGFSVTGRLDGLSTDDHGLQVMLGVGLDLAGPAAPCVPALEPPACIGQTPVVGAQSGAMFGVGVNEALLNRALHRAWQSGLTCIDSDKLEIEALASGLDSLATMLGQPRTTRLGFSVRLGAPPRLRLSKNYGLELVVEKLAIDLHLQPAGAPLERVGLQAGIVVAATPWINPANNSIALDLHQLSLAGFALEGAKAGPLALDPARLQRFIAKAVVPLLRARLLQTQLSPSLINAAGYVAELRSIEIGDGYLAAHINAYKPTPSGDTSAPETTLRQSPASCRPGATAECVVGPQVLDLLVEGSDNRTPAQVLRYQLRVNGGAWSEPSYGGRFDVVADATLRRIEIAAVDEDGNVDPTPVTLAPVVDDIPPQLAITARPGSLIADSSAQLSFAAKDDRTPRLEMITTAQLLRVPDGGGLAQVVSEKTIPAGGQTVRFSGLVGGVYKIRVTASDGVGNVTSVDTGFVVELGGGCSTAPGSPSSIPLVGLALVFLAFVRRRD